MTMPAGIWVDAAGFAVNLKSPDAAQFIRACAHVLDMMEKKTEYNEPEVGDIHPGIKDFLNDLKKPK